MSKLRQSWIVLMVAMGLLAAAGVAAADDVIPADEQSTGDPVINFAYDEDSHVFVVHPATTDDDDYDCMLPAGDLMIVFITISLRLKLINNNTRGAGYD